WDASVLGQRAGRALSKVDDVTGSPVVSNGVLYAGSQAGRTIAVNAESGSRRWTSNEGAVGPVWPTGDSIFSITDRNEL
ncbi:MAG TPA: quinoprotein, partial [Sulfitobacter sp.]|nr:quinoprotein [Sulfitobacter sp.]